MKELISLLLPGKIRCESGCRRLVQKIWQADPRRMVCRELACSCHDPFKFASLFVTNYSRIRNSVKLLPNNNLIFTWQKMAFLQVTSRGRLLSLGFLLLRWNGGQPFSNAEETQIRQG